MSIFGFFNRKRKYTLFDYSDFMIYRVRFFDTITKDKFVITSIETSKSDHENIIIWLIEQYPFSIGNNIKLSALDFEKRFKRVVRI